MSYFTSCSVCGANNDPGERCGCQKEKAAPAGSEPEAANGKTSDNSITDQGGVVNGPITASAGRTTAGGVGQAC